MIMKDYDGKEYVLIPEHIFKNKQGIDWGAVERYLQNIM